MHQSWSGDERRTNTNPFNVRSQLMRAIDGEDDAKTRNSYMLMLGILEAMDTGFGRIEQQLTTVMKDEQTIKKLVLNGHDGNHHKHHDWVEHRMSNDKYYTDLIARSLPLIEWVEAHRKEEEDKAPVCAWVETKMEEEQVAKADKKTLAMKFLESIFGHIGTAVAAAALVWFLK